MQIKVLGCYGAEMPGYRTSGFLINEDILLDAGTVVSVLSVKEQLKINNIIISHTHLDHIKDIQFLADNVAGKRKKPINLISTRGVLDALRANILNDIIWPDFTIIPSKNRPVLKFLPIREKEELSIGSIIVKPVQTTHTVEAVGYIIRDRDGAMVYTGDTGHTDEIWKIAVKEKNLKAIFAEVSFPNRMAKLADISGHLTVKGLSDGLKKMGSKKVRVYISHMKPQYLDIIEKEVALLNSKRVKLLKQGDVIQI